MSNCPDICTADKCRELEERIEKLESDLELLKAAFESHTEQEIPEAHKYEPEVDVALAVNSAEQTLKVFVSVDDSNDSETVTLPKYEPDVDISLAANSNDNTLKMFVKVGDKSDEETISLPSQPVNVEADISGGTLAINVAVGDEDDTATVDLPSTSEALSVEADINSQDQLIITVELGKQRATDSVDLPQLPDSKLNLSGYFQDRTLTLRVADGNSADEVDIYIPSGGGSGGGNEEPEEQTFLTGSAFFGEDNILVISINSSIGSTTFSVEIPMADLEEIKRLLEEVHEYTVIDVNGETVTGFICPEQEEGEVEENHSQLAYSGKSFTGLHGLLTTVNDNLLTVFTEICEKNPVLAAPDWWQVRLAANRPQIVCTFRRGSTRTYHSLTIPHPAETDKPEEALIPQYSKGNWQGMIVLIDNSKFIVNCNSAQEAERICGIAASLIRGDFLPNPFKVWITERKGEPVANDLMRPTSILYYSTGQRNLNPDWYMAVPRDNL